MLPNWVHGTRHVAVWACVVVVRCWVTYDTCACMTLPVPPSSLLRLSSTCSTRQRNDGAVKVPFGNMTAPGGSRNRFNNTAAVPDVKVIMVTVNIAKHMDILQVYSFLLTPLYSTCLVWC